VVWFEFELLTSGLKSCVLPVIALSNTTFHTYFTPIDIMYVCFLFFYFFLFLNS
jgi:hypothetical protein